MPDSVVSDFFLLSFCGAVLVMMVRCRLVFLHLPFFGDGDD